MEHIPDELDEIEERLKLAELSPAEEAFVQVTEEDLDAGKLECQRSCLAKLFSMKDYNVTGISNLLTRAWKLSSIKVCRLDRNFFQIFFEDRDDIQRTIDRGPWNIANNLLVIIPWQPHISQYSPLFSKVAFWVQLWRLPRAICTDAIGYQLWKSIPNCSAVQLRETFSNSARFFRMRVQLDISQALKRIQKVGTGHQATMYWGILKYERLPHFCFTCGRIGHVCSDCSFRSPHGSNPSDVCFGNWMKAKPSDSRIVWTTEMKHLQVLGSGPTDGPDNKRTGSIPADRQPPQFSEEGQHKGLSKRSREQENNEMYMQTDVGNIKKTRFSPTASDQDSHISTAAAVASVPPRRTP